MSAVPIIIASQNGALNISPTVSYSLAIISCIIIISICVATIVYGGDEYKKNRKNIKNND